MLAVVVLAVLATVQVECAPTQLWPVFDKVSAQPTKKPVFAAAINKETQSKAFDPSATQHAYEQFINTWLRQASLTLNRPDILKLITSSPVSSNTDITVKQTTFIGEPVVDPVPMAVEQVTPDSAFASRADPLQQFVSDTAEPLAVVSDTAEPLAVVSDTAEPLAVVSDTAEPLTVSNTAEPLAVSDTAEPLFAEPEMAPEAVAKQLNPVPIEQTSEATLLTAEQVPVFPDYIEVVGDVTPLDEELLLMPLAQEVLQTPVTEEPVVPLAIKTVAEPIPSLVDQDTATVLIASPPTPLADPEIAPEIAFETSPEPFVEAFPLEFLQPTAKPKIVAGPLPKIVELETATGTGKSFSSVKTAGNVIPQQPAFRSQVVPQSPWASIPTFASTVPVAPTSAVPIPGAVTTRGLTYTLQFFPTRSGSHYFISTPIGG